MHVDRVEPGTGPVTLNGVIVVKDSRDSLWANSGPWMCFDHATARSPNSKARVVRGVVCVPHADDALLDDIRSDYGENARSEPYYGESLPVEMTHQQ